MYISPELWHWELHRLWGSGEASEGRSRGLQGVHRVPAPGPLFVKRLFPMKEFRQEQECFSALPDRGAVRQSFGEAGKVGNREGGDQRGEACMGQSCVKIVSKLSQSCLRAASQMSQNCLKVVSKLSQSCLKAISKLSQSCLKVVS